MQGTAATALVVDTLAAGVSLLAALVVFGRFRRSAHLGDVVLVWAFVMLAVGSVIPLGGRLELTAGVVGALALLSAAGVVKRDDPDRLADRWVAVAAGLSGPAIACFAIATVGEGFGANDVAERQILSLVTAFGYGGAAFVFSNRPTIGATRLDRWIGAACVVASASHLAYAFEASTAETLRAGDLGRLGFAILLATGAVLEIRGYWVGLGVADERRRVAREIHDGLAQELVSMVNDLRRPPDAIVWYRVGRAADRALDDSRRAILALTSSRDEYLDEAVLRTAEAVAAREGAEISCRVARGIRVAPETRDAVVRIVREALANAVRHGGADSVSLALEKQATGVRLVVHDDGKGFSANGPPQPDRLGLRSMVERAEAVGAVVTVSSTIGEGTSVEVRLPWAS